VVQEWKRLLGLADDADLVAVLQISAYSGKLDTDLRPVVRDPAAIC
jgi:hypothetical protein